MCDVMFTAIAVGQGDAFFLRKHGFTCLVDGGRSRAGFPILFRDVTKLKSIDVIVCTHNDADHANGVLGLLESGFPVREVWLPASWVDRLEDIILNPKEFFMELCRDIFINIST